MNESTYKVDMTLRIRSVSAADFGSYKCVAKNSLGETDSTIKLYSKYRTFLLIPCHSSKFFFKLQKNRFSFVSHQSLSQNFKNSSRYAFYFLEIPKNTINSIEPQEKPYRGML